jgi:DNA-binding NtrC family response regulator
MTEPAPRDGPAPGRPARILVVDDEPGISEVLSDILSATGYEVDTAADGLIALDKLAHGTYDAILSDVHMPALDGIALYRAVEARYPDLVCRFILVTGSALTPEAQEFITEVRIEVVAKPFDLITVVRTVKRILEARG